VKNSLFFNPITCHEIKRIYTIKPKSSTGSDGIPSKHLRELPKVILEILAYIFNQSIVTGKFISSFKTAKVVPVFKQGNSVLLNNYIPISLLSTFFKI